MKLLSLITLFAFLVALSNAAPIPSGEASWSGTNKGKGKAHSLQSDSEDDWLHELVSRAGGGTTAPLANIPLPGRSGVHHDTHTGIMTAYYGDDDIPEHMGHLQRNQALHPSNREPMALASDAQHKQNRIDAQRGIETGGTYRNTGWLAHLDEKHIAMLDNPHHATTTTVERLPQHESNREGGLTSTLKSEMLAHGAKGQLRPNPGWLTPADHQRVAHEAPARLNSETRRPDAHTRVPKKKSKPDPEVKAAEAKKKAEGYTPEPVGPSGMGLRHRPAVLPPPPHVSKAPKPQRGETNLTPGRVGPPHHIFSHPNDKKALHHGASHAGAPVPLSEAFSNSRHPPRPQNEAHLLRQKLEAQAAEQEALHHPHPPAANLHPGPNLDNPAHNTDRFRSNLAAFNTAHPPHAPAHGAHPAEAPARLEHIPAAKHDAHRPAAHHNAHPPASHQNTHPPLSHSNAHPPTAHNNAHTSAAHHNSHPPASHQSSRPPASHGNAHAGAPIPHRNAPSTLHQVTPPQHPAPPRQGSSSSRKGKGKDRA